MMVINPNDPTDKFLGQQTRATSQRQECLKRKQKLGRIESSEAELNPLPNSSLTL